LIVIIVQCLRAIGKRYNHVYNKLYIAMFSRKLNLPDNADKTLVRGFLSACWNTAYAFG